MKTPEKPLSKKTEKERKAAAKIAAAPPPPPAPPAVTMAQVAQYLLSAEPSFFDDALSVRATLTTMDIEYLVQVGYSEAITLSHLKALHGMGRVYEDFHHLLLAVHERQTLRVARRSYIISSLSYPQCTLFTDSTEPIQVEVDELDRLVEHCDGEVEWISMYVRLWISTDGRQIPSCSCAVRSKRSTPAWSLQHGRSRSKSTRASAAAK
jgi:hypothetical protein